MTKSLCLLSCHNQYESKRYFTKKLGEAFTRQGIDTHILTWPHGPLPENFISTIQNMKPTLTASFHQLPRQEGGDFFWDRLKLPHWTILLDPAFYDLELMSSPYAIISCVDRGDCALLSSYHFKNNFFFPHAVEQELICESDKEDRPIDIIMLGSCYDPDNLYEYWKKTYSEHIVEALEDAVSRVLSDNSTSFFTALLQSLTDNEIDPKEVEFDLLASYVDAYSRGIDRINLIRSIKSTPIHVYGGKCWREELPVQDWSHYLSKQSNVTVHPSVNFDDGLKLLKKSKICLNSMPFFKNGTHERVFASIACGAIPVTSDNLYFREIFEDDNQVIFYQSDSLDDLDQKIQSLLKSPDKMQQMIKGGQKIIARSHTWDHRAKDFLTINKPQMVL